MKNLKYLLFALLLIIPTVVNAEVRSDTPAGLYDTQAECDTQLALNESNTNASNGYYLSCIKISCLTSVAHHEDIKPLNSNVTCANGNTNPYRELIKSGIGEEQSFVEGTTCSTNNQEENYLKTVYATRIDQFNCLLNRNGNTFDPNSNSNKTEDENNPQTGINTYYIVLSGVVIFLSAGLYVVNKKNFIKKI
ncbi:MAG: LPXTG cell wall anchor domain-containing protein [Bacilli bacterium]|nr:LPXTG cell wall anchor domain-containing protein [Bacilli bacterium]